MSQPQDERGTYSSAHSFSFRICSSSSLEKLIISYCCNEKGEDWLVLDVEEFSDLFWGFTLDHVGYCLASDVAICQLLWASGPEQLTVEAWYRGSCHQLCSSISREGREAHFAAKIISNNISWSTWMNLLISHYIVKHEENVLRIPLSNLWSLPPRIISIGSLGSGGIGPVMFTPFKDLG